MGEQDMERELVKLVEGPQSMDTLYRISEIYIELGRLDKASESLIGCVGAYFQKPGTVKKALDIADMGIKHWKLTRYSNKEQLRINLGDDRAKILSTVLKLLELAQKNHQKESKEEHKNRITFMIAFINENVGMLQEALQAYSDLIALQAMDCGVDLTFIIMKASVILTHVGNHSQAVEYLEFLLDDPPATEGYGRTHILAFLAMTYEHHPKRADFATTLKKTYLDLQEAYSDDLSKGNRPQTNEKMMKKMLEEKSMSQASEVWEMIALQAIDRCEHLVAYELMHQAVEKAPSKHKSLYLMAEICYQLNYVDRATAYAESAFKIQPQNVELRDFLLMVAPEVWQDKLRNVATTKVVRRGMNVSGADSPDAKKVQKAGGEGEEGGGEDESFFTKVSSGASAAVTAIKTGGLSPEQALKRERMQAARAKKKEEKAARKEKKLAIQKMEETSVEVKRVPGKKRDPTVDGPARPPKPVITQETLRLLEIAREGKNNIHYYDRTMMAWAHARVDIEREDRQWRARIRDGVVDPAAATAGEEEEDVEEDED